MTDTRAVPEHAAGILPEKPDLNGLEHHELFDETQGHAPPTSAFAHLSTRKAIWTFRRLFLTGAAASLGATCVTNTEMILMLG